MNPPNRLDWPCGLALAPLAPLVAASGLAMGVAAAMASWLDSSLGAMLAIELGCAWLLVRWTARQHAQWPPDDDEGAVSLQPQLANEESLWAQLAQGRGGLASEMPTTQTWMTPRPKPPPASARLLH